MEQERLAYLLTQYEHDALTAAEKSELQGYIDDNQQSALFEAIVASRMEQYAPTAGSPQLFPEGLIARKASQVDKPVDSTPVAPDRGVVLFIRRWWVAASVVLLLAAGTWWVVYNQSVQPAAPVVSVPDIQPGHDGAILALPDGSTIVLDSMPAGIVATHNGSQALLQNGQLVYTSTVQQSASIDHHTLSTPKGRQFHVQLPDGTGVWLNSASSIQYPTHFTGSERRVSITGEVYFEVAKNAAMPFLVQVNDQTSIRVLGTQFNVKAYTGEAFLQTTLLEGAVQITAEGKSQTLVPGEQARVKPNGELAVVDKVNTDQVLAWKKGLFDFKGYDIPSMMREIGRWYDLDIVYESTPAPRTIVGAMERSFTLAETMATLKDLGIHYRLEGRTLIITH